MHVKFISGGVNIHHLLKYTKLESNIIPKSILIVAVSTQPGPPLCVCHASILAMLISVIHKLVQSLHHYHGSVHNRSGHICQCVDSLNLGIVDDGLIK